MKLCNDFSYVKSDYGSWGGDKAMRSTPSLTNRGGRWYAVWQVDNKLNQFATTFSDDLFLWKPQDYPYAQGVATVYNPLLCSSAKGFTVVFTTKDGKYYSTSSRDFVKWDSPKAITKADYDKCNRQTEITVAGVKLKGEKHRMAYKDIEQLRVLTTDQKARSALTGERAAQDSHRFRGMSGLKAVLNVRPDDKKPISDKLMGIFFEDINYAADGGLYAEMVQNRDFEYSAHDNGKWNAMTCWTVTGSGLKAEIATESPIHENNPHYVRLETTAKGGALQNSGYDGIAVKKGAKLDLFLFGKNISGQNTLKVRLVQGSETVAETTIKLKSDNWQQCKAVLTAAKTADNCVLSIEPQQPGTAALDFISLFPQATFKNRKNGVRVDLAQALADMKPRFVRFPGGCLSHGNGLDNMYRWKETIGDLWARKPQKNIWSYHQTKGLGFYEYFQLCEDLGAEPLPVLPAGVPCQNSSCEKGKGQMGGLPMEEMEAYTQELLDLIEWANADAKTSKLAAMRAKAGHPKPFNLKMIGIGNEDIIGDVFTERFNFINKRIKAKYPDIQVVGTVGPFNEGADYEFGWQLAKRENIDIVDEHYYVQPGWYIHNQNFYDKYDRNGTKVYLGEWASWGSELENALAEAIHLTNVERNADVVVMASYAPLFARKGHT
ncbi:MAG: alpha-L-arabinofuranosidase, partial [Bacteroidaceae bacterium]|nr:alpha-L-arabinofuranosidase [Bacteroidaceae bacterium]